MDKNLLRYKGVRPVFMLIGLLTLVQGLSILLLATNLAQVISGLFAGEPWEEQWGAALLFLSAFLVRHGCGLLMSRIAYRFAERTAGGMRREMMDKLFRLGPRLAGDQGTGGLVTLALEGVTKFRTYLELIVPRMVGMAVIPPLVLVYVFWQDRSSGVILTLTMPIIVVFMILIGLTAKRHTERQLSSYRTLSNHFVDSLRGLETLKVLGRSREHIESITEVSDRYRSATMKTLRVAFLSSFALDFFTMLSVASVAVSLGLRLVNEQMLLGTALAILILAPEYFLPVRLVGADFHATMDGKQAGAAMQELIRREPEQARLLDIQVQRTEAGYGQIGNGDTEAEDGAGRGEAAGEPATGKTGMANPVGHGHGEGLPAAPAAAFAWQADSILELRGVGMRHEAEGRPSLDDVSLRLPGTGKIGIVGESGAGKSTLVDILSGFLHPTAGSLAVNGTALSALTDDAWRSQTAYIPQRPYLFSATLAENVAFYNPDAGLEEIARAAAAAGLSGLIGSLPLGLNEPIGGGGRTLSGGQAQRVALARALLGSRPILLLDEPTAHLDIETEYELKQTMLPLFEGKLVLLATHRLHWMADMDHIIVMQDGRIAESGTHEELVARRGVYYGLLEQQLEGVS